MSTTSKLINGEELLAMGDIGRCELIYGEVVKISPSGFEHSEITASLGELLRVWNRRHAHGAVLEKGKGEGERGHSRFLLAGVTFRPLL